MSTTEDEQLRETWENIPLQPTQGQLGYCTDDAEWQREMLAVDDTDGGTRKRLYVKGHPPDDEDDDSEYAEQWLVVDKYHVYEQDDWK